MGRLVNRVKAYQKEGPEQKELWGAHCDQNLGGVRDPARHDVEVLQNFMRTYGVSETVRPVLHQADPMKEQLVERVKVFQRSGEVGRDAWLEFAGSTLDPNRKTAQELLEFIEANEVS